MCDITVPVTPLHPVGHHCISITHQCPTSLYLSQQYTLSDITTPVTHQCPTSCHLHNVSRCLCWAPVGKVCSVCHTLNIIIIKSWFWWWSWSWCWAPVKYYSVPFLSFYWVALVLLRASVVMCYVAPVLSCIVMCCCNSVVVYCYALFCFGICCCTSVAAVMLLL